MAILTLPLRSTQTLLVDGHVHLPDDELLSAVLEQTCQNFHAAAIDQRLPDGEWDAVLLLTEIADTAFFQSLKKSPGQIGQGCLQAWLSQPTLEPESLVLKSPLGQLLYVIAGHQIVTQEKLEILALCCLSSVESGLPLTETVEAILEHQGIPVLPWGFGKWMGPRGQVVLQFLMHPLAKQVYLGDNGGRPSFWAYPPILQRAQTQGLKILSGSDPLPLPQDRHRVGSFGISLRGSFDAQRPAESLRQLLIQEAQGPIPYGSLQQPLKFVQNQLQLKLAKGQLPRPQNSSPVSDVSAVGTDKTGTDFPSFAETADIETSSEDYASRFAGKTGAWLLQVQEQATLKMLTSMPNASVLDVGGGHGQLTQALVGAGHAVTVLGSAAVCQNRIQSWVEQGACQFDVGNVLNMPYADASFDVVISYRFLAHVTQWQRFVSELARVAKTAVIVDYPTVRSVNSIAPLLFKFKKEVEGNTRPYTTYVEAELVDYFRGVNFTQTGRYAQFALPMVVHRMLKSPPLSAVSESMARAVGLTHWLGSPVIACFSRR